jgi:hypothetical protein
MIMNIVSPFRLLNKLLNGLIFCGLRVSFVFLLMHSGCKMLRKQVIASLKTDKESLESQLFDLQQINAQLELRKEQLEAESQELLVRKENLLGMLSRVRLKL